MGLYSGLGYTGYGLGHHLGFAGHLGYGYGLGYRAGYYYGKYITSRSFSEPTRTKWIVISLNFPSPVLQFQCYHTKSLVMVSRKQENQSGKNQTNIKITKKKK